VLPYCILYSAAWAISLSCCRCWALHHAAALVSADSAHASSIKHYSYADAVPCCMQLPLFCCANPNMCLQDTGAAPASSPAPACVLAAAQAGT
jgi:hypothetical protein